MTTKYEVCGWFAESTTWDKWFSERYDDEAKAKATFEILERGDCREADTTFRHLTPDVTLFRLTLDEDGDVIEHEQLSYKALDRE